MGEAIELCRKCPINRECLIQALANNEQHGVWGGFTPSQRQQIKGRI